MDEALKISTRSRDLKESEDPSRTAETDDDSLILWMLSLTPTERLKVAQGFVDSVAALRKALLNRNTIIFKRPVWTKFLMARSIFAMPKKIN